jgi:hypothetical protein
MPRVGDEAFEQWYSTVVPGTFRTVHRKDPVPHLPTMNMGFHHMPYEVRSLLLINSAQISPPDNMHVILCRAFHLFALYILVTLLYSCGLCAAGVLREGLYPVDALLLRGRGRLLL